MKVDNIRLKIILITRVVDITNNYVYVCVRPLTENYTVDL